MKEKRVSNKLKQKQLETKYLEEQTKKMEDKLTLLKRQIEQQKQLRSQLGLDNTITRWQKAVKPTTNLKSYAKQVLQQQKQVHAQYGINQKKITGTKAFEGILKQLKIEKEQEQDKNPTKIATFLKQQPQQEPQQLAKTVLENNFFKAKMDTKKLIKQKTLQQFLEENFILQYLQIFREEGIEDLQGLRYITRDSLQQMGVKAGHQVKIIKKIKEEFQKLLNGKIQQPQKQQKVQTGKVQSGYGDGDVNSYLPQPLLHVQSVIKQQNIPPNLDQQEDEEQEQDVVIITQSVSQTALQTQQQGFFCFQCYRKIEIPTLYYDQKFFCSQPCMNNFFIRLKKQCPCCKTSFIKTEGFCQNGVWFCSLGCSPSREEVEQLFFQWRRSSK